MLRFGGQSAPRPPPATGRFAFLVNAYEDPIQWPFIKSLLGFGVGIFLARKISEEWILADVAALPSV